MNSVKTEVQSPNILILTLDTEALTSSCVEGERMFLLVTLTKKGDAYGLDLCAEFELQTFYEQELTGLQTANKIALGIEHEIAVEKASNVV
jgi:hypothetical protein